MLFSIIVANYNNGKFLPKLIETVLAQTYTNWELIIADDCSTIDKPVAKMLNPTNDNRIKFVFHKTNKGAAATFKTSIENSNGEIVGMLGADDGLMPNAFQKMTEAFNQYPTASMINSNCYSCKEDDLSIIEKYKHYQPLKKGQKLIEDICVGNFVCFRKDAYNKTDGFDSAFKKALDHDIFLKLDEVGTLHYVDDYLYLYRQNPIGISQGENGIKAAQFSMMAKHNAYWRRKKTTTPNLTDKEYRTMMQTWYIRELFFNLNINKKYCKILLLSSIKEFPSFLTKKFFWSNLLKSVFNFKA